MTKHVPQIAMLALLVVAQATFAAAARPVSSPPWPHANAEEPEPLRIPSVADVWLAAQRAYATAPYAERLDVEVTDIDGRVMRSSIRLCVDPRQPGADGLMPPDGTPNDVTPPAGAQVLGILPSQIRIDFGSLHLWAGPGELVAIHQRDPSGWWGVTDPQAGAVELVSQWIPPTSLPSLAILSGTMPLSPLAPSVEWTGVSPTESQDGWVLAGRSGDLAIQAMFDRASHRLVRLVVAGPSMGSAQRVSIAARQEPFAERDVQRPSTAGREARESLSQILRMVATVRAGDPLPRLACVRQDGRAWSVREAISDPTERSPVDKSPGVILLLLRATWDGTPSDLSDVRAALTLIRTIDRERIRAAAVSGSTQPLARLKGVPCVVFELESFSATLFERVASELSDLVGDDPGVVWTSPARQSIDLIEPNAAAVAIIVDGTGIIRAVVPLDGLASDPTEIEPRLSGHIMQMLAPQE